MVLGITKELFMSQDNESLSTETSALSKTPETTKPRKTSNMAKAMFKGLMWLAALLELVRRFARLVKLLFDLVREMSGGS